MMITSTRWALQAGVFDRKLSKLFSVVAILTGLLSVWLSAAVSAQTIRYVSTTGTNFIPSSATSWATASSDLQAVIDASNAGDQIWVASGLYRRGNGFSVDRTLTFTLKSGVALYGGFAGTETNLSQRPAINPTTGQPSSTTLSGDIAPTVSNNNAYHVITNSVVNTNVRLDGFVVTAGTANASTQFGQPAHGQFGGGLYFSPPSGFIFSPTTGSTTITNCSFVSNTAGQYGGALYATTSGLFQNSSVNITLTNTAFLNNSVNLSGGGGKGGAISGEGAASASLNFNLTNVLFDGNVSSEGGAAMYNLNSSPTINNSIFRNNQGVTIYNEGLAFGSPAAVTLQNSSFLNNQGGAIRGVVANGSVANVTATNCHFQGNTAGTGGVIFIQGQVPTDGSALRFTNCSFLNNSAGFGGVFYTFGSSIGNYPLLTNCSFQGNSANTAGSVIFTGAGGVPTLNNCVLFNNGGSSTFSHAVQADYSLFDASVINYSGSNNLTTSVSPFASTTSTQLSTCSPAINAGNPSSATATSGPFSTGALPALDLAGNPRIAGGRVDMGAYESSVSLVAGAIAGSTLAPFPQELPISFTSLTAASASATPITLSWQQSGDNGAFWTNVANANAQTINMPTPLSTDGQASKVYQFQRVVTDACSRTAVTSAVSVTVIQVNGRFTGQVVSSDGITPVAGVTVTVVRTTPLPGSPGSWTYTAMTGADGSYNIAPVYFGVQAGTFPGSPTEAFFTVTPRYTDPTDGSPSAPTLVHTFSPTSQTFVMNQFNTPKTFNFTDNTTFAIAGQTRQTCTDCITGFSGQTPLIGAVTCPVDGATIRTSRNGLLLNTTQTAFIASPAPGDYGRFAVAVNNPGVYSLSVTAGNLVFVPASQTVNVTSDVYNVNFNSATTQTIVGRVSAGCGEAIGSAVLEFADVLLDDSNNPRTSCFRKRVTTTATGSYTIVLPARKYKVSVISLTPNGTAGVSSNEFVTFVNTLYPTDSLTRDLTSATAVTTLNLTYQRPPTLLVSGLVAPPVCGTTAGYYLMQQGLPIQLVVTAYQGPVATGCVVGGGTVLVSTNIQIGTGENFSNTVVAGSRSLTLVPGQPNIVAPFYRNLNIQFTDMFGRSATPLNRNVVVTGTVAGAATFETVSPQIPLLVLHDPPGNGSFSFWQSNSSQERAMRFYTASNNSTRTWLEAKVGVKFQAGLFVTTETSIWGTIGGGITASGRNTSDTETIVTTSTSSYVATSSGSTIVGDEADVFIGAALNMWYSVATVIAFNQANCTVGSNQQLMVANKGIATQYYYTAYEIKNSVIPGLKFLSSLASTPAQQQYYDNQIRVWQQVLDNNDHNKQIASFVTNKSFDGGVGQISESVTKAVTQNNTIEFAMEIDAEVAAALGFEIAGNGISGGVTVNFKTETGNSIRNSTTNAITTGYTLSDSNVGDRISVDVKTDPVYGTPLFALMGGKTSCPPEEGTQPRDAFQLTAPVLVQNNVATNGTALFTLNLANISQVNTDPSRTMLLSLVPGSNPDGASITINGSPYIAPIPYTVNRLSQIQVTVAVTRNPASSVYAYPNLQFQLTDNCGGDPLQTVALSAFFQSPCSSISLVTPGPNWVSTQANNNQVPILINGYTVANLSNVTLQYQPVGGSWTDGPTLTAAQLGSNETQFNWNTTGLPDGAYQLRMKLTCSVGGGAVGTVYSPIVSGLIDRVSPVPFGNTQPANDQFALGSTIGIAYNEVLDCSRIGSSNVVARRVSNGQLVPMSVGCFQNQVTMVPLSSLAPLTGDVISLTLTGVTDLYGNPRSASDSWLFGVGSVTAATGSNALSVQVVGSPISETSSGQVAILFNLPAPATNNVLVNFGLAGTAQYGVNYTTAYASPATQPLNATVTGTGGSILIPAGNNSATLLLTPRNDNTNTPDLTAIVSLLTGGDYLIGAPAAATVVIQNVAGSCLTNGAMTTVKSGFWNDPTVWSCGTVPTSTDFVQLNHAVTLPASYVAQTKKVSYTLGAQLLYQAGARLQIGF